MRFSLLVCHEECSSSCENSCIIPSEALKRESPPWCLLKSFKGLSLQCRRGDVGFGRSGRWGAGGVLMKDKIKLHNSKCEIQCIWSPTGCRAWTFRPFLKVLVSFASNFMEGQCEIEALQHFICNFHFVGLRSLKLTTQFKRQPNV